MSPPKQTPSLRKRQAAAGGVRRNSAGVTPAQAQAATLAQLGRTVVEIAQEMQISKRSVHRHLAAATRAGIAVAPQGAKPREPTVRQDPATGQIQKPRKPGGRVRCIGITGQPGYRNAALVRPEPREAFEARTGLDTSRHGLGKERAIGEHDGQGRVLVGQASGLMEHRRATDYYLEQGRRDVLLAEARAQAPPGATAIQIQRSDGSVEEIPL